MLNVAMRLYLFNTNIELGCTVTPVAGLVHAHLPHKGYQNQLIDGIPNHIVPDTVMRY